MSIALLIVQLKIPLDATEFDFVVNDVHSMIGSFTEVERTKGNEPAWKKNGKWVIYTYIKMSQQNYFPYGPN